MDQRAIVNGEAALILGFAGIVMTLFASGAALILGDHEAAGALLITFGAVASVWIVM